MSRLMTYLALVALVAGAGVLLGPSVAGAGRLQANPLNACTGGAFSTEEDFMMMKGEPADGNPYISDGDLLSFDGQVCARNAELLANHYAAAPPPADLGLDAADILDIASNVVAFSTELEDPGSSFTGGDLLLTNGTIIPNTALVYKFSIPYDIGLDAVHFTGQSSGILAFASAAAKINPGEWGQGRLAQELERYSIDVWFSIEGTYDRVGAPDILDGDLLSAATGLVVYSNAALLPASVPAGLPSRGVDFGLDAVAGPRQPGQEAFIQFSTEILFRDGTPPFNDGDVLLRGNGVVRTNEDLIQFFYPAADFLGLDALALVTSDTGPQDPNIQTMCGDTKSVADFDGGMVAPGGPGTGLYRDNPSFLWPAGQPRRPCGEYVPIDGYLPSSNVKRFRVAYRPAGGGATLGVQTHWRLKKWDGVACALEPSPSLNTDANGWMDASDYMEAKLGGPITGWCANSGMRLAVWDTANHQSLGPTDKDGHYVLWLEWEDNSSVLHTEPFEHHLQLDNTEPIINDFKVTLPDGTTPVNACGQSSGVSTFKVFADFEDDPAPLTDGYHWGYRLRIRGGNPPASAYYGWHNYYDGTVPVSNTNETGTTPDSTTVFLRDINMNDLGASFTDCCYVLDLWVRDAAIRHSFPNNNYTNDNSGSSAWLDNDFLTFGASPP